MNLLFGVAGKTGIKQSYDRACHHIRTTFNSQELHTVDTGTSKTAYLKNNGCVLGYAQSSRNSLLLLGGIIKPLPGWTRGSPLDDPDATAAFLLDLYLRCGMSFLHGIQGQYAIVINDDDNERLLLASDPGGMRTFYINAGKERLIFSTSLSVAATLIPDGPQIDREWEDFFLIYGFYPFGHTPFRGVSAMPAGTLLEWKKGQRKLHQIEGGNPWNDDQDISGCTREQDAINKLHDAFLAALEDQTASTGNAAVLLGGVDSALVAAGLQRLGKQVETFSFEYTDSDYNQPYTADLAGYLNIRHNWIPITHETIGNGLASFQNQFNAPTNWPNYVIQTKVVCDEIMNRGFNYVYSGDGCDTVFLGYPGTHKRTSLLASMPTIPAWLAASLLRLTAIRIFERKAGHPYRVLLNIVRSLARKMPERCHVTLRIFDEISLDQLRNDTRPHQAMELEEILRKLAEPVGNLTTERLGYHGKSLISPNKNKIVGSSDCSGVVINSPYMHNGFKVMAAGLPDTLSRPKEKTAAVVTGKYILLRMAEEKKLLPHEVIYQKKLAAVAAPIDAWYFDPLKHGILTMLKNLPFQANQEYIDALLTDKLAERIYRNHISPSMVTSDGISLLATYASYCGLSI